MLSERSSVAGARHVVPVVVLEADVNPESGVVVAAQVVEVPAVVVGPW